MEEEEEEGDEEDLVIEEEEGAEEEEEDLEIEEEEDVEDLVAEEEEVNLFFTLNFNMTEGQKLSPQTGTSRLKINFIFLAKNMLICTKGSFCYRDLQN